MVVALQANYLEVELDNFDETLLSQSIGALKDSPPKRLLCTRRNRLIHKGLEVNVGDRVLIEAIDWQLSRAVISDVKPRNTFLPRPAVSNVTLIIIALSLKNPSFDIDQASRFLIAGELSGVDVKLLLTKRDLVELGEVDQQVERLRAWGYETIAISSKTGVAIEEINEFLGTGQLSVLCGPSGVGKTSLLNLLLPKASLPVGDLSGKLQRGRHTTRHIELYPVGNGSRLADTPGFNRAHIGTNPNKLAICFPEIRIQLHNFPCRFRDCLHRDELGCGIDKSWERYPFYRLYLEEILNSCR